MWFILPLTEDIVAVATGGVNDGSSPIGSTDLSQMNAPCESERTFMNAVESPERLRQLGGLGERQLVDRRGTNQREEVALAVPEGQR